jgi:hypothetical protein
MLIFFLSAINHSNDQVDENESDNMLIRQINFFDNQLIIIVIALPCAVGLIILFIIVVVVVVVRHLIDLV